MVLEEGRTPNNRPKRGLGKSKKLRRTVFLLPTAFTVGNIFAGFCAVISTLHGNYGTAALAIGIAVVLDGIDGRLARMTGSTSDFGLQLDSLADIISFGLGFIDNSLGSLPGFLYLLVGLGINGIDPGLLGFCRYSTNDEISDQRSDD